MLLKFDHQLVENQKKEPSKLKQALRKSEWRFPERFESKSTFMDSFGMTLGSSISGLGSKEMALMTQESRVRLMFFCFPMIRISISWEKRKSKGYPMFFSTASSVTEKYTITGPWRKTPDLW